MSSAAAIAAVTASLHHLLADAVGKARDLGIVGSDARVTSLAPDRISVDGENSVSRIALFLYEVSPNTGWCNERLASRDSNGREIANPYLALDLSYMLTAYGVVDLEAELLLGFAMQALHETPGLSRSFLRTVLDPGPPDGGSNPLPQKFRTGAVDLADQIELIKITPRYLKLDDMSKIWTSLQSHYRPSMAYQVTVVLIEPKRVRESAPPVLRIGPLDRGAVVQANLLPPFPTLLAVRPPDGQPAAKVNAAVEIFGHHLAGSNHRVILSNPRLDLTITLDGAALTVRKSGLTQKEIDADENLRFSDTSIVVDLSKAPAAAWRAGVYGVTVELTPRGASETHTTNMLSLAVAPAFETAGVDAPVVTKDAPSKLTVTLTTTPPIAPRQTASLFLGAQEITAGDIPTPTNKPQFKGTVPPEMFASPKDYLARLRVDGVDSLYIVRFPKPRPPEFDPNQRIAIP